MLFAHLALLVNLKRGSLPLVAAYVEVLLDGMMGGASL